MPDPFIGEIKMIGFNFAPRGWATCDGQLLPIASYTALFSLVGTTYGGDGRSTFGLPDLRGRFPMHQGSGPGLTPRNLGTKAGDQTVTLTSNQIPSHSHSLAGGTLPTSSAIGNRPSPNGAIPATANDGESNYTSGGPDGSIGLSGSTAATGGNQAHDNMPPFLTVNFVIALVGLFPSRN